MNNYKNFTICIGKQNYGTFLVGGNAMNVKSDTVIPPEPEGPSLSDISLDYDTSSTEVTIYASNSSEYDIDVSVNSVFIETSSSDYDESS